MALVIATQTYADQTLSRLRAPGRDATELASVLADVAVGGFEVETVLDAPAEQLRRRIARFCAQLGPRDLALVYLSCHGVLDDRGRLYYAATDTARELLSATAVSSAWLNEQLEDCRSRRQILVLDCCHSGAFARGAKGEGSLALRERFEGRGRVVLTGSRATEYSFEHDHVHGEDVASVFTTALVEGLRSGEADRDGDGIVTVSELYDYVYERVRAEEARQTPTLWSFGAEGGLPIAHSPRGAIVRAAPLPDDLIALLESARPRVRLGAVAELADLLADAGAGRALSARAQLERVAAEDVPSVAAAARAALAAIPAPTASPTGAARVPNRATAGPAPAADRPDHSPRGTSSDRPAERRPARRVRAPATIVVASAVAVAALGAILLTGGGAGRPPTAHPAGLNTIAVSGSPRGVAVGEGATWVARYDDGAVSRIDGSAHLQTIAVGAHPDKIVAGEGSVWVGIDDGDRLVRIDPITHELTPSASIDLEADGCGDCAVTELAIAGGSLWVGSQGRRAISRFDVQTGRQLGAPYHPGVGFKGVFAVAGSAVWAVSTDDHEPSTSFVVRIDDGTRSIKRIRLRHDSYLSGVAFGRETLWIADAADVENVVTAFDPQRQSVVSNIKIPTGITDDDIVFAHGAVLVWDPSEGWLTRIDASKRRVVGAQRVSGYLTGQSINAGASDLAVGDGLAWVTDPAGDAVHRVAF